MNYPWESSYAKRANRDERMAAGDAAAFVAPSGDGRWYVLSPSHKPATVHNTYAQALAWAKSTLRKSA
jgi:hypothetical protein